MSFFSAFAKVLENFAGTTLGHAIEQNLLTTLEQGILIPLFEGKSLHLKTVAEGEIPVAAGIAVTALTEAEGPQQPQ